MLHRVVIKILTEPAQMGLVFFFVMMASMPGAALSSVFFDIARDLVFFGAGIMFFMAVAVKGWHLLSDGAVIDAMASGRACFAVFVKTLSALFLILGLVGFIQYGCGLSHCVRGSLLWMYGGSFFSTIFALYVVKKTMQRG